MMTHIQSRNKSPVKYDYKAKCIVCLTILIYIEHSTVLGNATECLCTEFYFLIQLITVTPSSRVFPRKLPATHLTENSRVFYRTRRVIAVFSRLIVVPHSESVEFSPHH